MTEFTAKRLTSSDVEEAGQLFTVMSRIFSEDCNTLSPAYLRQLLGRSEFLAIAAFRGTEIVGGLTAHILPMTRTEAREVFLYDLAVLEERRRKGVGRLLVETLREEASALGIGEIFVAADNGDLHALEFYRRLGGTPAPVTIFSFSADDE